MTRLTQTQVKLLEALRSNPEATHMEQLRFARSTTFNVLLREGLIAFLEESPDYVLESKFYVLEGQSCEVAYTEPSFTPEHEQLEDNCEFFATIEELEQSWLAGLRKEGKAVGFTNIVNRVPAKVSKRGRKFAKMLSEKVEPSYWGKVQQERRRLAA